MALLLWELWQEAGVERVGEQHFDEGGDEDKARRVGEADEVDEEFGADEESPGQEEDNVPRTEDGPHPGAIPSVAEFHELHFAKSKQVWYENKNALINVLY